jgi:DNA-binding NarL/FixJ family response regulator
LYQPDLWGISAMLPFHETGMAKPPRRPRSRTLTERQLLVLRMSAQGRSMAEIARQLGVSVNTVKKHVELILLNLGAVNRMHAIAIAMREGLLR